MAEKETKPPEETPAPVPAAAGIPLKMVIIIVAGTLVLGLGGAFALFKFMAGGHGGDDQKAEATAAKAARRCGSMQIRITTTGRTTHRMASGFTSTPIAPERKPSGASL